MEIKVINIGNLVLNNYILNTGHGCVVIDTGYPGGFGRFSAGLASNNLGFSDISFILLTHAHDDHAGFLGELLASTDAPLISHSDSVERLKEGHNRFTGGCSTRLAQVFCRLMALAGKGRHEFPPIDVSSRIICADQDPDILKKHGIPGEILWLPGHTGDSIGLLLDDGRLFCGDAAMNNFPSQARHTIWMEDAESFIRSWDVIAESGAKMLYPGHGRPFPLEDLRRYRDFMKGRSLFKL